MCAGLRRWSFLKRHCNGYDINCQYRKKFRRRMEDIQTHFPNLQSIRLDYLPYTLPAIGKFHAPAHTGTCRCKYSYNYLPGVGMTDGEAAERIWSILNGLAARTREMSPGHRHDVINHFYNDMNLRRLQGIGETPVVRVRSGLLTSPSKPPYFLGAMCARAASRSRQATTSRAWSNRYHQQSSQNGGGRRRSGMSVYFTLKKRSIWRVRTS